MSTSTSGQSKLKLSKEAQSQLDVWVERYGISEAELIQRAIEAYAPTTNDRPPIRKRSTKQVDKATLQVKEDLKTLSEDLEKLRERYPASDLRSRTNEFEAPTKDDFMERALSSVSAGEKHEFAATLMRIAEAINSDMNKTPNPEMNESEAAAMLEEMGAALTSAMEAVDSANASVVNALAALNDESKRQAIVDEARQEIAENSEWLDGVVNLMSGHKERTK